MVSGPSGRPSRSRTKQSAKTTESDDEMSDGFVKPTVRIGLLTPFLLAPFPDGPRHHVECRKEEDHGIFGRPE